MKTREKIAVVSILAVMGLLAMCGSASAAVEWTTPVPVEGVNTQYDEWTPSISFDGKSLYFSQLYADTHWKAQIYQATREDTSGPFTSVREVLSESYHVLAPWVSPDNLRIYYYEEIPGKWVLKSSERSSINDSWSAGSNIAELNVLGSVRTPRLTADELTIFFTSSIPGGQGAEDIWIATRTNRSSSFGNITNLSTLNSSSYDGQPTISPDGLMIYFASDRNGEHIFHASRNSLSDPFGNIEQLSIFDGYGHPFISSDGGAMYFTHGGPGDIYVSYVVPEPATVLIVGLGALMLRKKR